LTIPTSLNIPFRDFKDDPKKLEEYVVDLVRTLEDSYKTTADNINGRIRSNDQAEQENWTPTISSSTPGVVTYVTQNGIVLRKGLLVDLWFDIQWSNIGVSSGNLWLELPYRVSLATGQPFCGVLQPSSIAYTGGTNLVVNAIQNTYRAEIWYTGSGIATANQQITASGRLIGNIRYIGQDNDQNNK